MKHQNHRSKITWTAELLQAACCMYCMLPFIHRAFAQNLKFWYFRKHPCVNINTLYPLKTCCLQGSPCSPGFDGVSCPSPVFTQESYHSRSPLCPAATKTEEGTQSLSDLSCSHVSTRQCKDAAESHHGVATTATWKSHLPQDILPLVFCCSSLTRPSPFSPIL